MLVIVLHQLVEQQQQAQTQTLGQLLVDALSFLPIRQQEKHCSRVQDLRDSVIQQTFVTRVTISQELAMEI